MDPRVEFQWGEIDGITAVKSIYDAYQEAVHWKLNSFLVPFGKKSNAFVLYSYSTTLGHFNWLLCFWSFKNLFSMRVGGYSTTKKH